MTGRLLTARAVAERLDVHVETVLRWTRRGEIPAVRLSRGSIRFDPDELERWLEARSTGAAYRGVSNTQADRAHDGAYVPLTFPPSNTRPLEAATTTEED